VTLLLQPHDVSISVTVTTTLADVQAHLRTLITPSTILLRHSLELDLRAPQLSHPRCIDTALIFHHPRGRPLKPGLVDGLRTSGSVAPSRIVGLADMIPKRMRGPVWIYLKQRLKMVRTPPAGSQGQKADKRSTLGPVTASSGPITSRISRARNHRLVLVVLAVATRAAIVDHGNPGAWHGTSASAPATTVPCSISDADSEVIEGVVAGALDPHEFVFARLMTLADALGCTWACAFFSLLSVTLSIRS
jgi:RNA exonuclease 1